MTRRLDELLEMSEEARCVECGAELDGHAVLSDVWEEPGVRYYGSNEVGSVIDLDGEGAQTWSGYCAEELLAIARTARQ